MVPRLTNTDLTRSSSRGGRLRFQKHYALPNALWFIALLWHGTGCQAPPANGEAGPAARPNIVIILADDLGIMDIAAYGRFFRQTAETYYETPHLDRLVRSGLSFSQAYAQQLCSPSRASLLTGRFSASLGVTTATPLTPTYYSSGKTAPQGYHPLDAVRHADRIAHSRPWTNGTTLTAIPHGGPLDGEQAVPALPRVLEGYVSGFIGKWHLGGHGTAGYQPADVGFSTPAYYDAGGSPYFNWRRLWSRTELPYPSMPQVNWEIGDPGPETGQDELTADLTVQAVRFLEQRATQPDKPFLLYFNHFAVHGPWQAHPERIEYFRAKAARGWNGHHSAVYAAMVAQLDDSVGHVLDALERLGLNNSTLVVFTSDNGGVEHARDDEGHAITENGPFTGGKGHLYEGGVRVPFIARWPGRIEAGRWSDRPIHLIDILPTLAGLAGVAVPEGVDGRDLKPLLFEGDHAEWPERTLYWHYPFNVGIPHHDGSPYIPPHSAIRQGPLKLIWDWHGKLHLYDIEQDPSEQADLAVDRPDEARRLFEQLNSWLQANVPPRYFPRRNARFDPRTETVHGPFRDLREELLRED